MPNEVQTANAAAVQNAVAKNSNVSASEFFSSRVKAMTRPPVVQNSPPKEEEKPVEPPAEEAPKDEVPPEVPEQKPEEASTEETAKVLSKDYDLENMSEAELKELAQKLGSKAVARFGELTAKRKAAEEQLAALKAEMEKAPLEAKVKDNPYAKIESPDELQAKYQEVNDVIEWAEDTLDKAEHLSFEDVVAQIDGKPLTKAQVKDYLKQSRKARDVYLPDQNKQIKLTEQRNTLRKTLEERAKLELPWLQGEDNDVRKQYEAMLKDERLKGVDKSLPDMAPQLPYLLAHAANSIYARKAVEAKPSVKLAPPSLATSSGGESNKPEARMGKALKDLSDSFSRKGSYKDFTKLRALQLSKT